MNMARKILFILLGFLILAAARGAVALFAVRSEIMIQWFGSEPTTIFALPAVVIFAVGAAALIALIALITKSVRASIASIVPGLILAGYIAVEVLLLKQASPLPIPLGIIYFLLGGALVALAVLLKRQSATIPPL